MINHTFGKIGMTGAHQLHFGLGFLLIILLIGGLSCSRPEPNATKFDEYMQRAQNVWKFQGVVLVAHGDSILLHRGYGFANIEKNRPNTTETKFLIGSTTKPFTAIAILQLVEKGLIDLRAPISKYLPDYPKPTADNVTIHHLLSHTSGIPDIINNPSFRTRLDEPIERDEMLALITELPPAFSPGEKYAYSSSNYVLLGLIIEAVTGQEWAEYIQEHICRPAGMNATGVYYDYGDRDDVAIGYVPDATGGATEAPLIHLSRGFGAGAIISTAGDLYKLHQALNDTILLSRSSITAMLTPYTETYGYGWLIDSIGDHLLTGHGGGTPGFVSIFQRWPDDSLCVIVLSNNATVPVHTIATSLAGIEMGEPVALPEVKEPIELTPVELAEFEGQYRLSSGEIRTIALQGPHLTARRGEGLTYVVLPETPEKFYFINDHMTTLTFLRDANGEVAAHVLQQSFDIDTATFLK